MGRIDPTCRYIFQEVHVRLRCHLQHLLIPVFMLREALDLLATQKLISALPHNVTLLIWGVHLYLHVVHEDLCCHAHLQHSVYYQFAVGCEHISPFVKVLQFLHLRVFTDWEPKSRQGVRSVAKWWNAKEWLMMRSHITERKEQSRHRKECFSWFQDNGFSRWISKIT